jgi:hypothetical protein
MPARLLAKAGACAYFVARLSAARLGLRNDETISWQRLAQQLA